MKSSEFKILLLPFSSRLYRLAYGLLGNREEAEDTVQEVYLKLWKMREDLGKYNSLEALSVRITRNLCLDQLRRRKTTREVHGEEEREERIETEDLSQERTEILHRLINELPEPQRSLVYFRHIEGKEYHEIESLMYMKENAIRVSISRARKQLREMLQKQYASWIN
ncbi:MAG: RNA polymerase sigma factor [Bacteroidales bacterium]|nr:RNA polymerase sigma factor [Bacteroidales bacterium]MDT8432152.1 RNA polymerase sigma factor [Bacteroidales bacterium]